MKDPAAHNLPANKSPAPAPSAWALWRPYVFDLVSPFAAYAIVHAFGATGMWAMTAAGAAAGLSTLVNSIRKKGLDALGVLVLLEILGSLAVMAFMRDPRLMLVRPSVYTAIASVYLISSVFAQRPLTFIGSRQIATKGDPVRLAAYERTWENSREFRQTHRAVTLAFGLCLAVDSLLRVVIVFRAPLERSAWLSNVPHLTAMTLMIVISALAGRRFHRLVERELSMGTTSPAEPLGPDGQAG